MRQCRRHCNYANEVSIEMTCSRSHSQHLYQASAYSVSAEFERPKKHSLAPQTSVVLASHGGHGSNRASAYNVDGLISFKNAYSEVGESFDDCHGIHTTHAWSVVEGLNVADILTADRIVSRMTVYHSPTDGSEVSYDITGSYFENLRIAGNKVDTDPDVIWRSNDRVFAADFKTVAHTRQFYRNFAGDDGEIGRIRDEEPDAPKWLTEAFGELRGISELSPTFHSRCRQAMDEVLRFNSRRNRFWNKDTLMQQPTDNECSYFNMACDNESSVFKAISDEAKNIAYSISVPDFGVIRLAEVLVQRSSVRLKMIQVQISTEIIGNLDVANAEITCIEPRLP